MPVRWDFRRNVLVCDVCGHEVTMQRIAARSRLQCLWDRITGLEDAR
jgi:hypothetical protein